MNHVQAHLAKYFVFVNTSSPVSKMTVAMCILPAKLRSFLRPNISFFQMTMTFILQKCAKGHMEKANQHNWHGIPVHM